MTIDDLEALRQQLQANDNQIDVSFEFVGGEFDSATDLKQLSDNELQRIVVKTPSIQIVLSTSRSEAIGSSSGVESVYGNWARARQSKRRPAGWLEAWKGLIILLSLASVAGIVTMLIRTSAYTKFDSDDIVASVGILTVFLLGFLAIFITARSDVKSCAIIVPMSTEELRSKELEDRRNSKTIWAAIGGAVIGAFVTVIVAVLTGR